jgi:hypothetical protein
MKNGLRPVLFLLLLLGWGACNSRAFTGPLLENGSLEKANTSGFWPADWPEAEGVTWKKEQENAFLQFTQKIPGKMLLLHRSVKIPEGTKALRLSFRIRYDKIVPGEKPWFDAMLITHFLDATSGGKQLEPSPDPLHFQGSSEGWKNHSVILPVPEAAQAIELIPCLFQARGGTMDIDDIFLEAATDTEIAQAKAKAEANNPLPIPPTELPRKDKWPSELFVVGNRLQTKEGKEVWLQGIVIPSMEWSATGENALASALVAIEEWKGNILRLEVREDFWFGRNPRQNDGGAAYRSLVDAFVTLAANRGAYTMIDLHRYRAVRPEHLDFWKEVATVYQNHPAVLFDIFNEPHGISWEVWRNGGFVEEKSTQADEDAFLSEEEKKKSDKSFQSPGMQAVVHTIRKTGARNIIVAAGVQWSYDLSGITQGYALEDKNGNGIMYSWHVYNWHKDWEKNVMATASKYPILIGECGADPKKMSFVPADDQEAPSTWSPRFIGFVQKNRLNWTAFSFHPACTPILISDWKFTPSPSWGDLVKEALAGKKFEYTGMK